MPGVQIPMFRESCPLLLAYQDLIYYECLRCERGFYQTLLPYLGVCFDCWREWVANCNRTQNKMRWETFMKGAEDA